MLKLIKNPDGQYGAADDPGEPGRGTSPRLSVTDQEGWLLGRIAAGTLVLEIGTGLGVSTVNLSTRAARVETYDIDPWVRENIYPTFITHPNIRTLFRFPQKRKYDLVFIDGDHDRLDEDIENCKGLIHPTGIWVFHDYYYPPVREEVDLHFKQIIEVRTVAGIAIARELDRINV